MTQLVVFPHADLHLVRDAPALSSTDVSVFLQTTQDPTDDMAMANITNRCQFLTFSPYEAVGSRLDSAVTITPPAPALAGLDIAAAEVAIDLASAVRITFIAVVDPLTTLYLVLRVQVHESMVGWWFGNRTVTTAVEPHPLIGHTQPSIYAQFSDDGNGTDLVGDITGHDFVSLSSANIGVCDIDNRNGRGRLKGESEGTVQITGDLLGDPQDITCRVVDYAAARPLLTEERKSALAPADAHNVLILPEGFRDDAEDRRRFRKVCTDAIANLFTNKRHEPYPALADSFRVYAAYMPSEEDLCTLGYKVKDNADGPEAEGTRVVSEAFVEGSDISISALVGMVGLPLRGEQRSRATLLGIWQGQDLSLPADFATNLTNQLFNAWKASTSVGILEARDTFFGFMLGRRNADQVAQAAPTTPVVRPTSDAPGSANLADFIQLIYTWFRPFDPLRGATLDPRRHPPEFFKYNEESRNTSVMRFINALALRSDPTTVIGPEWRPTPGSFRKSRGLVAMIINDGLIGGSNINSLTITAQTLNRSQNLGFTYPNTNPATKKVMRRQPPNGIKPDFLDVENTVAHEFGHSFNLGDEYEVRRGDNASGFDGYDNIANHDTVGATPVNGRNIDPTDVKWLQLPRVKRAARLVEAASKVGNTEIEVKIPVGQTAPWDVAKVLNETVTLRALRLTDRGEQLVGGPPPEISNLSLGTITPATGTIRLTGAPAGAIDDFPPGSMIYVQKIDDNGTSLTVAEPKVLAFLNANPLPLNRPPGGGGDPFDVNSGPDKPKKIPDFKPPCNSAQLVGVFEGTFEGTGFMYRPAGDCKMRNQGQAGFCYVCKWLITNRVDASRHLYVDVTTYPEAKKNG